MKTLEYFRDLLKVYANQVSEVMIDNEDKRELVRSEFIYQVTKLRDRFPHLLYPLYPENISFNEAEEIVRKIEMSVKNNYFPIYPLRGKFIDIIGGDVIESPGIYSYQSKPLNDSVFRVYEKELNEWVTRLLLSLPLGCIELRCVNFNTYGCKSYHGKSGCVELKAELDAIVKARRQKYENYAKYCNEHRQIPEPYIVVLLKDDKRGKNNKTEMYFSNLYTQSNRAGVYFVIIQEEKKSILEKCSHIPPLFKDSFHKGRYYIDGKTVYIDESLYGVRVKPNTPNDSYYTRKGYDYNNDKYMVICKNDACDCLSCQQSSTECVKLLST